jgi:hypothetical protein
MRERPVLSKVETARSGRSKCRKCKQRIGLGETRVCLVVSVTRRMRRKMYLCWHCFAKQQPAPPSGDGRDGE